MSAALVGRAREVRFERVAAAAAIYSDLGSGTQFGSYLLPTSSGPTGSTFTLQLNSSFLQAFALAKQAHQQWFSIGGSVINVPPGDANFFGFTNEHEIVTLTVTIPKVCKISSGSSAHLRGRSL